MTIERSDVAEAFIPDPSPFILHPFANCRINSQAVPAYEFLQVQRLGIDAIPHPLSLIV
jgi:hypothetical protein